MSQNNITPTGKEIFFPKDDIIVSKTDLKGKLTYTNVLFETISGYSRAELLGQPHNIIRHPEMPRCIFKLLWDTLKQQQEIFAYVVNLCKNGDHYWVLAHVVPTYDLMENHVGYHSSRRCPDRQIVRKMAEFYRESVQIEKSCHNPKQGLQASTDHLMNYLSQQNMSYGEYIFSLNVAA